MTRIAYTFKLRPGLLEALKKLAQGENRALNNYVETVLLKHVKSLGYDDPEPYDVLLPRDDD